MGFLQKAGRDVETMPGTEKTFALKEMRELWAIALVEFQVQGYA